MKVYLSSTPDEYYCYENSGWTYKNDTSIVNTEGQFTACIRVKYWLGFFEDFKKILINARLKLILTRSNTDKNSVIVKTSPSTISR